MDTSIYEEGDISPTGTPNVPSPNKIQALLDKWPFIKLLGLTYCPKCGLAYVVTQVIGHLNDNHRWTRERIADWVETIEPAEEIAVEPAQEVLCEVK